MELKELANQFDTDKKLSHGYLENYSRYFSQIKVNKLVLLELGVFKGGSLKLWKEYFKNGHIVGFDKKLKEDFTDERIIAYEGNQDDTELLSNIAKKEAPNGFDIIIDDCSHIGELTKISFWHLFEKHLKPGGIYVIEDWGTGYWDRWHDGRNYDSSRFKATLWEKITDFLFGTRSTKRIKSHDFGLVGFVKELIDEIGIAGITDSRYGIPPQKNPKFKSIEYLNGQVFIIKE